RLLERIESAPSETLPGWILAGAWTLLLAFGFPPVLDACIRCGASLPGSEPGSGVGRFDVQGGGLLCASCGVEGTGPRMGPEAQQVLRRLGSGVPPAVLKGAAAHLSLVERYALHHLDGQRPFRATALLRASLVSQG